MTHKVYRGPAGQGARPVTVSVCEGEGEHSWVVSSAPLEHHVHHSPDGFSWAGSGSGAAELARCLLWDHLGAEPHPAAYQALKDRLIVPVHAEFGFSCTTADLALFCASHRGPLTVSAEVPAMRDLTLVSDSDGRRLMLGDHVVEEDPTKFAAVLLAWSHGRAGHYYLVSKDGRSVVCGCGAWADSTSTSVVYP